MTFRLDDDDALARGYLARLLQYAHSRYRGHVLTFPAGYKAWFDHAAQTYTQVAEHWEPKIALGLAYVGHGQDKVKQVFQVGNHTQVDRHFPLVSLPDRPMYLRSFHDDNDVLLAEDLSMRRTKIKRIFEQAPPVETMTLHQHFALGFSER
ncbi:Protein of unknown function (DUF3118) [Thiorhodovibrio frisius]|uniref:Uncharacterized protein n=1 Tax=Thiorhodovibrio frisius TaxID=631362 RepID=H8YVW8_9GAMM|nr:Protein of unknown function (DUF3118) [Thiorhodovibrio frisius]WPL20171.1 hypothetical protein Thiofri_00237 [Thiorhodovibrio frisius]